MTTFYRRYGKRALDLAFTIPALILLAPLVSAVALLVRWRLGPPVLYRQVRLGLNAELFTVFKYRTMTDTRNASGELLPDAQRLTPLGRWLRRLKLDELPQLMNVLRADMSLVGPRPALPADLALYDDRAALRLTVRPGLTGLAQVNGNTALAWPQRWKYDFEYVRYVSIALDVCILFRTLGVILLGEERFATSEAIRHES